MYCFCSYVRVPTVMIDLTLTLSLLKDVYKYICAPVFHCKLQSWQHAFFKTIFKLITSFLGRFDPWRKTRCPLDMGALFLLVLHYECVYCIGRGSARHLYVVCIYGAICLQIQKYFPPDSAVFSPKNKLLILSYVVSRFMRNISRFHGKIARYDVVKIKFVDISHHRYKLRRDIE